jgi:hypothetical protein
MEKDVLIFSLLTFLGVNVLAEYLISQTLVLKIFPIRQTPFAEEKLS